jgi:hypothetical protein
MALPRLQDYLPKELDLGHEVLSGPAREESTTFLAEHERGLARFEEKAAALGRSLARFVEDVESFRPLTEADVAAVLREIESQESQAEAGLRAALLAAEARDGNVPLSRNVAFKLRAVALYDREAAAIRSILTAYGQAKHRLLSLRDRLLVHEAQEMSAHVFWGDDGP